VPPDDGCGPAGSGGARGPVSVGAAGQHAPGTGALSGPRAFRGSAEWAFSWRVAPLCTRVSLLPPIDSADDAGLSRGNGIRLPKIVWKCTGGNRPNLGNRPKNENARSLPRMTGHLLCYLIHQCFCFLTISADPSPRISSIASSNNLFNA
jgi:hypothetical protein